MIIWSQPWPGYITWRLGHEALKAYQCMQADGVDPDHYTFVSLFKACSLIPDLQEARKLHEEARKKGFSADVFVGSTLISMYGKCGSLISAERVFQDLTGRNTVSWNAMASAYLEHRQAEQVLRLYRQMQEEDITPNQHTFVVSFQACGILAEKENVIIARHYIALHIGQSLHADARNKGFSSSSLVANTIISVYAKCQSITQAEYLFVALSDRDTVSWNVMISAYADSKQGNKALQLYVHMQEEGIFPDAQTVLAVLQTCSTSVGIDNCVLMETGWSLHKDIQSMGFASDVFINNKLMDMYAKLGYLCEAENIFVRFQERDIVSWNVMLSVYVEQIRGEMALQLYMQLQNEGVVALNLQTYGIMLQACTLILKNEESNSKSSVLGCLAVGYGLHADLRKAGFTLCAFIGTALLNLYGNCNCILEAESVFDMMDEHDTVSWTTMLLAYVECCQGEKALQLFKAMQEEGVNPDQQAFLAVIQACDDFLGKGDLMGKNKQCNQAIVLEIVEAIHADALKKGYMTDVVIGSALMRMYQRCGCIMKSESLFESSCELDCVSWTVLLLAYLEEGLGGKVLLLFRQMKEVGVCSDAQPYAISLQACCTLTGCKEAALLEEEAHEHNLILDVGRALHANAWNNFSDISIANCAMAMYAKCGSIVEAENVFDGLGGHTTALWNSLLSTYVQQRQPKRCLQMFWQMQLEGIIPDSQTFVFALQACSFLGESGEHLDDKLSGQTLSLKVAEALHVDAWWKRFDADAFVGNTLISVYGKTGTLTEAEKLFNALCARNVVSWNVMLLAYTEQGHSEKALQLYRQMIDEDFTPDQQTLVTVLQACGTFAGKAVFALGEYESTLEIGLALHADSRKLGYSCDVCVGSSLICMYGKCGSVCDAENVFYGLAEQSIVLWNSMLSVYMEHSQEAAVVSYYIRMKELGIPFNDITLTCVIEACSTAGSVALCKQLHFDAIVAGYEEYPLVARALIRAYGSASCMLDAQAVFDGIPQRDSMLYSACIAGYSLEGNVVACLQLFKDMQLMDIIANAPMFLSLLCACSRTGLVSKGIELFESMIEYGVSPNLKHFIAIVDLLGRAGKFKRVEDLLLRMPIEADWTLWMCVLGAACTYGNVGLGKRAFGEAVQLKPMESAAYVYMSNILVNAGTQDFTNELENLRLKDHIWRLEDDWVGNEQGMVSCFIGD